MKNLISTVISRRTLQTGKECSAYMFSPVEMKESLHWNKKLQGFTISGAYVTTMEDANKLIEELDDIHINLLKSTEGSEILFVQASKETLNAWYKMMWEGKVSTMVCEEFAYFAGAYDEDAVQPFREKCEKELANELIQI